MPLIRQRVMANGARTSGASSATYKHPQDIKEVLAYSTIEPELCLHAELPSCHTISQDLVQGFVRVPQKPTSPERPRHASCHD